jgi:putative aldouronate transport system permease protein
MTLRMATMVLMVLPVAVVYPFLQKYFVKGIMIGSIKG